MSNHPQLELFFTNAIWSTSHFIQNFLRVLLTLRTSPSDYKALPPTLDMDTPTANFPLDTTAQRCQKLGSKSGWIFAEDPERRLEDGLEWMWEFLEEDVTGHNAHPSGALAAGIAYEDWVTWLLADLLALASRRISSHHPPVA